MAKRISIESRKQKARKCAGTGTGYTGLPLTVFFIMAFATMVSLSWYVIFRGIAFLQPGYHWPDRVFAVFLLGSETFLSFHAIGYLLSLVKSSAAYRTVKDHFFVSVSRQPPVAVVVATYNEDPEIVEDTLSSVSNLDYPAKNLYLLDDSTNQELQQRTEGLAKKYGGTYVHRDNRRGYKAGALNDLLPKLTEKYLAVFDADQKPVPDFLGQVISLLACHSELD